MRCCGIADAEIANKAPMRRDIEIAIHGFRVENGNPAHANPFLRCLGLRKRPIRPIHSGNPHVGIVLTDRRYDGLPDDLEQTKVVGRARRGCFVIWRLAALPEQVDHAVGALASRTAAEVNALVARITDAVLAEVFTESERTAIRLRCLRSGVPLVTPSPPGRRPVGAEDRLLVFMGVSGGLSVGKLAAAPLLGLGVAALNPLVWPVTIGLGLGAGFWMARPN